jgi:hypothetical protein
MGIPDELAAAMSALQAAGREHGEALAEYNAKAAPKIDHPGSERWTDEDLKLWDQVLSTADALEKAIDRVAEIEGWRRPPRM